MNTSRKTALVIGATGIVGRAIVEELGGMEDWSVIAVSNSGAPVPGARASISADLSTGSQRLSAWGMQKARRICSMRPMLRAQACCTERGRAIGNASPLS